MLRDETISKIKRALEMLAAVRPDTVFSSISLIMDIEEENTPNTDFNLTPPMESQVKS